MHAGYQHQVSHHIHCNDEALDEDVFSAFPFLRFDPRLPKMWWHQFQHIYMWFTFPLLQVGFQITDLLSLAAGRTPGASLYGATNLEKATTLLGKVAHFGLLFGIPLTMHSAGDVIPASIAYVAAQGVVLASTFAVSHNVPETKPLHEGAEEIAAAVRTHLTIVVQTCFQPSCSVQLESVTGMLCAPCTGFEALCWDVSPLSFVMHSATKNAPGCVLLVSVYALTDCSKHQAAVNVCADR